MKLFKKKIQIAHLLQSSSIALLLLVSGINPFLLSLGSSILTSCSSNQKSYWQESSSWYNDTTLNNIAYDNTLPDVFYLVCTEVVSSADEQGNPLWQACLNQAERTTITEEMSWVAENISPDGMNFVSPYYHQFTFEAICSLGKDDFGRVFEKVRNEVCHAFDYYTKNINPNRPFVLAGFSQGAMLISELVKNMSERDYNRMAAAYMLGYRLSAEDLEYEHIKAAEGSSDTGVTISFNSVLDTAAIWSNVTQGACTCINPVNWKIDDTPATFEFQGTKNCVQVNNEKNVLLVETDTPSFYTDWMDAVGIFAKAGASNRNLHHWDLLFYAPYLKENIAHRVAALNNK